MIGPIRPTVFSIVPKSGKPLLRDCPVSISTFPTSGTRHHLLKSLISGTVTFVTPPSEFNHMSTPFSTSATNVNKMLEYAIRGGCGRISTLPACIQIWAESPRAISLLKQLSYGVDFAGAPLSTSLGTQLVKSGVQLNVLYGSTEIGLMLIMNPTHLERGTNAEEWMYIEFPPEVNLRVVSAPETSFVEIQFLASESYRPAVCNIPDVEGFQTGDVFEAQPSKERTWKFVGTNDDTIIHSSTAKTTPGPIEDTIQSHEVVKGVIAFGEGRDKVGILVEY